MADEQPKFEAGYLGTSVLIFDVGTQDKAGVVHLSRGKGAHGGITLHGNRKQGQMPIGVAGQPLPKVPDNAEFTIGGDIFARNDEDKETIEISGTQGRIRAGGNGANGVLQLYPASISVNSDSQLAFVPRIEIDASGGRIRVRNDKHKEGFDLDGPNGDLWVGGNGASGDILLFPPNATNNHDTNQASLWIGGTNGGISFRDTAGKQRILLEGQTGRVLVGGAGADGLLQLFDQHGHPFLLANIQDNQAWFGVGGQEQPGFIEVRGAGYTPSIQLDGAKGDIILQNADCAEEFDIAADAAEVEPGTVMVVDEDGKLRASEEAFDRRVAGVISGAGDYKPGIVLDRQYSTGRRLPIALVGKVFCKVDADHGAIQVGDLLTTSPTPGHAMKAGDPIKAFGAVLGKALRPLRSGQGLIPVLVALQ